MSVARRGDSLPADVRRDLDRAAEGIGRTPTTAHPDCICYKRIGTAPLPEWLWQHRGVPEDGPVYGRREDCPQHKPLKR